MNIVFEVGRKDWSDFVEEYGKSLRWIDDTSLADFKPFGDPADEGSKEIYADINSIFIVARGDLISYSYECKYEYDYPGSGWTYVKYHKNIKISENVIEDADEYINSEKTNIMDSLETYKKTGDTYGVFCSIKAAFDEGRSAAFDELQEMMQRIQH